jgi:glycosyltransferase involved in cell wall biosynthesis
VPLNLVICNSRYTCRASEGRFPDARRAVCYAPVSVPTVGSDRAVVRAECGTRVDAIVIAVAARMESWKGQAVLIDALTAMADDPRWHGWVLGGAQRESEREYLEGLKEQARRGGIADRVSFLGDREDVHRLLAAADVYCQPNAGAEPFGLSFVEALAAGLPVVATGLGALPEIVDETCGILVPRGEPGLVAAALTQVMDPATRLTLADGARARARSFGDLPSRLAAVGSALESVTQPADTVSRTVLR